MAAENKKAVNLDLNTMPHVADGFAINVFAKEPHIINPSALVFDKKGRLYVGAGPQYRTPQKDSPKDYIKIFIDEDGDGVAETVKTFAEGLNSVQGMLWKGDQLWIANSPDITMVRDTDGDDVADEYTLVFTGLNTLRHGVHGFNWGPDGYLYFSMGNTHCGDHAPKVIRDLQGYKSKHGDNNAPVNIVSNAKNYKKSYRTMRKHETEGGMLRFRHDGSGLELYARGMRNPWDICMDSGFNWLGTDNDPGPEGDRVFNPVPYGHYGFRHAWNFDWKGTHDSVAPSGLIFQGTSGSGTGVLWYTADHFPKKYQNQYFVADWTNNCIFLYETKWDGALQVSKNIKMTKIVDAGVNRTGDLKYKSGKGIPLFRPTDTAVGPDGAMYIAGWGSVYGTNYTPESKWTKEENAKYQGRVFRLRHKNALIPRSKWFSAKRKKSYSQWSFDELIEDLGHQQEVWRVDAQEELILRAEKSINPIIKAIESGMLNEMQETWAIWALSRIKKTELSKLFVAYALGNKKTSLNLRIQCTRIMGANKIKNGNALVTLIADKEPRIRLAVAQTMAKVGFGGQAEKILMSMAKETDRVTFYTNWQVMRRLVDVPTRKGYLKSPAPGLRYMAALSLMEEGKFDIDDAMYLAVDKVERNSKLANFWMAKKNIGRSTITASVSLKSFKDKTKVSLKVTGELNILYTLDGSEPSKNSQAYKESLTLKKSTTIKAAGFSKKGIRLTDVKTVLVHKISESEWKERLFVMALELKSIRQHEVLSENLQRGVSASFGSNHTYTVIPDAIAGATMVKLHVKDAMNARKDYLKFKVNLPADVFVAYDSRYKVPKWMVDQSYEKTKIVVRTSESKGAKDLNKPGHYLLYKKTFKAGEVVVGGNRNYDYKRKINMYHVFVLKEGDAFSAQSTIAATVIKLKKANPKRGKELFFGRGTCFACHKVEGKGNVLGPDLNGIGKRRDSNYVITSIIKPSAYIVEGYQQTSLELKNGAKLFGMVQEETKDFLKIALPTGKFQLVKTADIKKRDDAKLSGMPAFSHMLKAQDIADITAWLMKTKALEVKKK